jgi:hypothetical protein
MNRSNRLFFSALFVLIVLLSTNKSAMAQSRIFPLFIENVDYKPVKVTLSSGDGCYEGDNGGTFNIAPGEKFKITLARVQGHGCNGKNGHFTLEFDPAVGLKKTQNFAFDNGGSLWLHTTADAYPGLLSAKSGKDESYTYTTFKNQITAGKVTGSWDLVFGGTINKNVSKGVSYEKTNTKQVSPEIIKAISVSLESGMEFELASVKASVTASKEKIQRTFMSTTLEGKSSGETLAYNKMVEKSKAGKINAVWQWVGSTKMSDGSVILIGTNMFTCTPDFDEPNYLPGDNKDKTLCN